MTILLKNGSGQQLRVSGLTSRGIDALQLLLKGCGITMTVEGDDAAVIVDLDRAVASAVSRVATDGAPLRSKDYLPKAATS